MMYRHGPSSSPAIGGVPAGLSGPVAPAKPTWEVFEPVQVELPHAGRDVNDGVHVAALTVGPVPG